MTNLNQNMGYSNMAELQRNNVIQYPYANNNLLTNTPYDNYMGRLLQQNTTPQYLKCRPVASREEAMAAQIDLDGSLWVFTDVGNNRIYTKQINNDGTAIFRTYGVIENQNSLSSPAYVTKEEFSKVIQQLNAAIAQVKPQGEVKKSAGIHFE